MLLIWSSTYSGQTLKVLSDWIETDESSNLYQQLIRNLWLQQNPEQFSLTLAAFLCRERLLPDPVEATTQQFKGNYLAEFDAILNGRDVTNSRIVFGKMIMSLLRVLCAFNSSEETVQLLAEVLDKESLPDPLDGLIDQYCAKKFLGHDHKGAFEEVKKGLLISVEAILKTDKNVDSEWMVIPKSP